MSQQIYCIECKFNDFISKIYKGMSERILFINVLHKANAYIWYIY